MIGLHVAQRSAKLLPMSFISASLCCPHNFLIHAVVTASLGTEFQNVPSWANLYDGQQSAVEIILVLLVTVIHRDVAVLILLVRKEAMTIRRPYASYPTGAPSPVLDIIRATSLACGAPSSPCLENSSYYPVTSLL